ncbi:hypothetical protein HDU91_004296 [Kappamyces sp. JEL0680]|nr:hypothetical protein HDU91_004296 [Kappamyces sp. JEL0680]
MLFPQNAKDSQLPSLKPKSLLHLLGKTSFQSQATTTIAAVVGPAGTKEIGAPSQHASSSHQAAKISDLSHVHVYHSGKISEPLSFSFGLATDASSASYLLGAAGAIQQLFSPSVLEQSAFVGSGLGANVASLLRHGSSITEHKDSLLEESKTSLAKAHSSRRASGINLAAVRSRPFDCPPTTKGYTYLQKESTSKVSKKDVLYAFGDPTNARSFIDFDLWDTPSLDLQDVDPAMFKNCGALVFVIDAQDDFIDALQLLYSSVIMAYKANPSIAFEVFIHKVDGLSDDHKIEIQHEIHQRLNDELSEAEFEIHLSFHLTSIYDHSIFEAFSKVIQKLIVELPTLENLLNILCSNSGIEKTFLFDVSSKIYIATDSSPVDM